MPELRLTEKRIRELPSPVDRSYERYWDTDVTGLCVKVTRAGSKRYLFKGLLPGRKVPIWHTGPSCSDYGLEDMRDDVREWKVQLTKGENPFAGTRVVPTVFEVCEQNLQSKLESRRRPPSESHVRDIGLCLTRIAKAAIGQLSVDAVSIAEAAAFLDEYRNRPRLHDRLRWWMFNSFEFAIGRGYLPLHANPWHYVSREYSLPSPEDLPRFTDEEIARLASFLRKASHGQTKYYYGPIWIGFIWFLIRAGTRPNDTRIIERQWIDQVQGQVVIRHPRTKTGKKIIYLSPEAACDLERLPVVAKSPFLFPGRQTFLKNYATSFSMMREETGLTKPPYGIRRWFASTGRRVFKGEIKPVQDLVGWESEEMALRYAGDDEELLENIIMENAEVCRKVASRVSEVLNG